MVKIVATTSLPVDRLTATDCNADAHAKMENNGENSGPLTSLPVGRLTATDCNAAARAKMKKWRAWLKFTGINYWYDGSLW